MLEERIAEWRSWLARRPAIAGGDVEELEDHLRSQLGELEAAGLAEDEAFLVAVKRLGDLDALSREFAEEYSERLWKQLVVRPEAGTLASENRREAWVAVGLATAAAAAVKLPELFGRSLERNADQGFYALNLSLLVLPFLAAFFAWKRGLDRVSVAWIGGLFAAGAAFVNLFPFAPGSHTGILAALHL
ncbi:MAG TPA: permease prefix domain 1-containing protein, partial [Thermoanaerobaculia bacterium]|nr:permease prefix domain 1-containing protein [Thermoanaerobaculia bacterium]